MIPLPPSGLRVGLLLLCVAPAVASASPAAAPTPAAVQDAEQTLETIESEFEQETKELRKILREAASEEERSRLYEDFSHSIVPEFTRRYAELARASRGSPVALRAWLKAFGLGSQYRNATVAREALDALVAEHIVAEELAELTMDLRYGVALLGEEPTLAALRALAERSPHRKVKGAALFTQGCVLGEDRPAGDPKLAEARKLFESVRKDYTDVEYYGGRTYAQAAEAFLFELDHLQVGMPAPDFEALDAEGVAFKLSDYQGKVVLVDFWGFW